jgi:hypothetical protein
MYPFDQAIFCEVGRNKIPGRWQQYWSDPQQLVTCATFEPVVISQQQYDCEKRSPSSRHLFITELRHTRVIRPADPGCIIHGNMSHFR